MSPILCDYNDHPPIKDVVFVVEETSALNGHFEELITNYLVQTLEFFNEGPHTTVERSWASIECTNTFSLVCFRTADCRPRLMTRAQGPYTSAKVFFNALESIQFSGGLGETKSCGSDGLADALRIFNQLDKRRDAYLKPGHPVSKFIVYIANSAPFEMPVQDVVDYIGQSIEDLIKKISEKKIFFNVIGT